MPNKRWVGLLKNNDFLKKNLCLTISFLFSDRMEGTKETSYYFFNNL
jgi:hypothetical protein